MINFDVSPQDREVIDLIVLRALGSPVMRKRLVYETERKSGPARGVMPAHVGLAMDLTAVHSSGTALRLSDLLAADDFNFAHDVMGIYEYLDRNTGQLTRFFVPRFAI